MLCKRLGLGWHHLPIKKKWRYSPNHYSTQYDFGFCFWFVSLFFFFSFFFFFVGWCLIKKQKTSHSWPIMVFFFFFFGGRSGSFSHNSSLDSWNWLEKHYNYYIANHTMALLTLETKTLLETVPMETAYGWFWLCFFPNDENALPTSCSVPRKNETAW